MNYKLINKYPIQLINEDYVGYGVSDDKLKEMNYLDLREELIIAYKHIKIAEEDLEEVPKEKSFVIKERLKNANYYKDKIENRLATLTKTEKIDGDIPSLKKDLKNQLDKNTLSKETYDRCIENLNHREENLKEMENKQNE